MLECRLQAIGLIGSGLPNWESARAVLRGDAHWAPGTLECPRPRLLRANEYRRATPLARLVLATAEQVLDGTGIDSKRMPSVFATSSGDLEIAQRLCQTLAMPDRPVSPSMFNNSVHNSPAGYFSIASGSHLASTSIAAGKGTAAAGLLEAASIAHSERLPTLLVVYDAAPAEPLASCAGMFADALAVSILIGPAATGGRSMDLSIDGSAADRSELPAALGGISADNPAAALVPLLSVAARDPAGSVALPRHGGMTLRVALGHA